MTDPYHFGELEIQERTGERDRAILNARAIVSRIPETAKTFLGKQQYCALGLVSPEGDVWSSFAVGRPGFAASDEAGSTLVIDLTEQDPVGHSIPPLCGLSAGDHLGVLFVDLATRRRLRVNGKVAEASRSLLRLDVAEAFANCPKYIQRRELGQPESDPGGAAAGVRRGQELSNEVIEWIAGADTMFVASAHPDGPVDVSHRGGSVGFVNLHGDEMLIPDYPGNSMFCTLGNFAINPRAGLTFVDFGGNRQLQLTGDVRLDVRAEEDRVPTGGAGRWWAFAPRSWIISSLSFDLEWRLVERSPYNP